MEVGLLAMTEGLYFQDFYLAPDRVLVASKVHSGIQHLVVIQPVVVFARPDDELRIVFPTQYVMVHNAEGVHFARWTLGATSLTQSGFGRLSNHRAPQA
jgi:hypothetical protein